MVEGKTTAINVEMSGEMDAPPPQSAISVATHLSSVLGRFFGAKRTNPTEWLAEQRDNVRPWLVEFCRTSNFRVPTASVGRLSKRLQRNVEYFQANYLYVFIGVVVYCLLTTPLVLFALCLTFYVGYKLRQRHTHGGQPLQLCGRQLTLTQLYLTVAIGSMPLYYLVGAHGAMFWILAASFLLIMAHATFYNIEALVAQRQQQQPDFDSGGGDLYPLMEHV